MPDHFRLSRYLAPVDLGLWCWDDDGQTVTWASGTTIAFLPEIVTILTRLAPSGLPPFGAVVLVLAACRDYGCAWNLLPTDTLTMSEEMYALFKHLCIHWDRSSNERFQLLNEGLQAINQLPVELRSGVEVKAALVEAVFGQTNHRGLLDDAESIVASLQQGLVLDPIVHSAPTRWRQRAAQAALECLLEAVSNFDAAGWPLCARTGLNQLPKPAAIELPLAQQVRRLLGELAQDQDLAGVARLARTLMAAVELSRPVTVRDDLPIGGVSDITNRGTPDRLLISELANDKAVLAVRIALGEALYLRREEPARLPAKNRYVLLDAGIRLWGLPRVFATAVGLAVIATTPPRFSVQTFRAAGGQLALVDLGSRDGLTEHLEALRPEPHPGAALAALCERAHRDDPTAELVVVTSEDTWSDPAFQTGLQAAAAGTCFLATVTREGVYRLRTLAGQHCKLLRTATLDLGALLERASPSRCPPGQTLTDERKGSLPLIFSQKPFPLLLSHPVDPRRAAAFGEHGVIALSHDGRLMHWQHRGQGARQLAETIPRGKFEWLDLVDGHTAVVVAGAPPTLPLQLLAVDLETGEARQAAIGPHEGAPIGACTLQGLLAVIFKGIVLAVDPRSGEQQGQLRLPGTLQWRCGRFFWDWEQWHALAFDGRTLKLEPIPLRRLGIPSKDILTVFDRAGMDGPWLLTRDGWVMCTADGQRFVLKGCPIRLDLPAGVSRDGQRAYASEKEPGPSPRQWSLDLQQHVARLAGPPALEPAIAQQASERPLRNHLSAIGFDQARRLILIGRRQRQEFVTQDNGGYLRFRPVNPLGQLVHSVRRLEPMAGPPGTRYTLHAARWTDGSRAILDSRGLLHLQSSDLALPEITLVLVDQGPLAAWESTGRGTKTTYYLGDQPIEPAAHFLTLIERFVQRLL